MKQANDTDVTKLPLELRCCFFVQGWKLSYGHIKTVDDWAEQVGWLVFYSNLDETSREEDKALAVSKAKEKVAKVIAFAESLFLQR